MAGYNGTHWNPAIDTGLGGCQHENRTVTAGTMTCDDCGWSIKVQRRAGEGPCTCGTKVTCMRHITQRS